MLDINIPKKELDSLSKTLGSLGNKAEKVSVRVVNKTATFSKREEDKQIRKIYHIDKDIPKQNISIRKARGKETFSSVITINKRCSLDRFKVKESPGRYPKGIHVYTEKGKRHLKNSKMFFGYYKSDPANAGLFIRTGGKTLSTNRQAIIKPYGPSLGDMASNPIVDQKVIEATREKLLDTFYDEMEKEMMKNG